MEKEVHMKFDSLEAIVDFAIEKEKEAVEFYSGLAQGGGLFRHQGDVHGLRQGGSTSTRSCSRSSRPRASPRAMKNYKLKWIKDIKRSDYVVELEYRKGMAYNEILMLAMKREEKALKLYNDFLKQAETPESQKVFKMLCQEEAKHKLALETMYDDYMAKMGD
ncbi:MAG: rubrerythrin [Desulfobacterales bacterium]|nr:rubrerythrin [Desulfobacterales bacterium]